MLGFRQSVDSHLQDNKKKKAEKWWGLIQSFDFAYIHDQTNRKKTLGFWIKCGFEINKEIKGNETKKWWVLRECLDLV